MKLVEIIVLLICIFTVYCNDDRPSLSDSIKYGYEKLIIDGVRTQQLQNDIKKLMKISNKPEGKTDVCDTCNVLVSAFIELRRNNTEFNLIRSMVYMACREYTTWGIDACKGYITIELETLLSIIDEKKDLTSQRICSIYFQKYECEDPNKKPWHIVIPGMKKPVEKFSDVKGKILHLTDIHFDPLYEPGTEADCGKPLCCQKGNGPPKDPKNAAGYWGDYHFCDVPWHSVVDLLQEVKKKQSTISYVYFTGDIISHRSWDTSIASNTAMIRQMYGKLYETFGLTPVYPVLGNHEAHPTDFWSYKNVSNGNLTTYQTTQWLFDLVVVEWSRWLPKEALETVKKGGYYTVVPKPKFRVIALNSNVCYTLNLWLFFNDEDPYGQLQWLADTLKQAEDAGESVHILSHVPPGNVLCLENWNEEFNKIIVRFSHIIKAQFNGHTHLDEFRLYYDKGGNAINVAFNGGSFTPFVPFNPNYRIYDFNEHKEIEDYAQYTYNLSLANQCPSASPKWYKLYSFKDAFGIDSLSLKNLGDLVKRMETNNTLMQQYFRFQVRESVAAMAQGCNEDCLKNKLCAIRSVRTSDAIQCHDY